MGVGPKSLTPRTGFSHLSSHLFEEVRIQIAKASDFCPSLSRCLLSSASLFNKLSGDPGGNPRGSRPSEHWDYKQEPSWLQRVCNCLLSYFPFLNASWEQQFENPWSLVTHFRPLALQVPWGFIPASWHLLVPSSSEPNDLGAHTKLGCFWKSRKCS